MMTKKRADINTESETTTKQAQYRGNNDREAAKV